MPTQEQWNEAFEAKVNYENEIISHNSQLLANIGAPQNEIDYLINDASVSGKMQIFDEPTGDNQNEHYDFFSNIFIDQWTLGIEGDSYGGFIYAEFQDKKWLRIPYNC